MAGDIDSGVVLIVEDDPSIRLLIREMLHAGGFTAVEASDGEMAMPLALEHMPDAILLDIGLPGVDGLTVLEHLKADPLLAGIPVIMVTAWAEPEHVERAIHAGAHDYVRKPFDTTELIARVETAVRIKAKHDAMRAVNVDLANGSSLDALTGLPNRRALDEALAAGPAAVVLLDLTGFQAINAAHGHAAGDGVLVDVAARLRAVVPADVVAGRRGGDEFMVVMPGAGELAAAELARRIADAIAATPLSFPGGGHAPLRASVGWAAGEDALARAEAVLYRAKAGSARAAG